MTCPYFKHLLILSGSLGLVACNAVVKTPYTPPPVDMPTHYQQVATGTVSASTINDHWWMLFGDKQLNRLVDQVLAQNNDLAAAAISMQKARLQAGLAADQQGVQLSAGGSTGYTLPLGQGQARSNGVAVNGNVSYVLDLFGKLSNQTDAARWQALATTQDLQATAQTLIGTTCQLYWQLGQLNQKIANAQTNVASSRKLASLVRIQYNNGAVSGLEMTQAEQAVQGQLAALTQLKQQKIDTRVAIAILLNQPPQLLQLAEPAGLPPAVLPAVAAGLPAELLARRPDVRAAELRLRQALAQKDATTASYYPSISLTGSLGSSSTSLTQLLRNPLATLGANLSLPFLQRQQMQRNLAISELDYRLAINTYRSTLYRALGDVDTALANRVSLASQLQQQQKTVSLAKRQLQLTQIRYKNGAIVLNRVIDAQDALRQAELALTDIRYTQYLNAVTLMQALGGSPIKQLP